MRPLSATRGKYALFGVAVIFSACRVAATPVSEPEWFDRALFSAVVATIIEDVRADPVSIDPRPLIADGEVTRASENTRAPVSSEEISARRAVLRDLGVAEAKDDGSFGTCPSVMVPPPPPPGIDRKKSECPKSRSWVANIGLPRAGGAHVPRSGGANLPNLSVREGEGSNENGQVAVRALMTFRGPEGTSMTGYDFVMAREGNAWKLVKKVALFWVE